MLRRFCPPSAAAGRGAAIPLLTGAIFGAPNNHNTFGAVRWSSTAAPKNPYKVLGLKPGASVNDIKKAHRVLTRKFHPDVPGGTHEKFQEIQDAYEQVKSGVWVKKGGDAAAGDSSAPRNRYANFRFTTGDSRRKQNYEDIYTTMHTNKAKGGFDDGEDEAPAGARKSPFGPDSVLFQAWFRLIAVWACLFVVLRIGLFLTFPPKHDKVPKKQFSAERTKKPPPPKPLAPTTPVLG